MSFIGYLNPSDWKSDWTNNDPCNFTWSRDQTHVNRWSRDQTHVNSQSSSSRMLECKTLSEEFGNLIPFLTL